MLPSLTLLIKQLSKLPGIGERSATRLVFSLLKWPKEEVVRLGEALVALREKVTFCKRCFSYSEDEYCPICLDTRRNKSIICVVETPSVVDLIEKTGAYNGLYHVLGGSLSPLDGITPDSLNISALEIRLAKEPIEEIIIATNPNIKGETTAQYLSSLLKARGIRVSRLAQGLPMGSDMEYFDGKTIALAIEKRDLV
jgi:recombination protein RecR